jgi:16S rRNA processing protein RimM
MSPPRICVAEIAGAHGTRGEVKLKSFTTDPMAVKDYAPLETEDGTAFRFETIRAGKGHLIAHPCGVHDRAEAEQLAHTRLYVARERLPPPGADEFYHADLIGLSAVNAAGEVIGTVVAVHDFGAGDILELRPPNSDRTIMLPFTETCVPRIDIAAGRIVVAPPDVSS